jgi:hypothetical protein
MKKILVCLFGIAALTTNAQDVYDYYEKINEGRKFVIDRDLSSALNSYRSAFEKYDHPFARDCYNAIELSISAKDTINLDFFLQKGLTRGIRIKDLESSGLTTNYLKSNFYKKIKEKEDSLLTIYSSKINWELRNEVNQMFLEDQKMRELYYKSSFFKKRKIGKEWEVLNRKQIERLIEITEQYGFPGENLIGIDRREMHSKIRTNNYSAGMPIVILIHHFSQPNLSYDSLLLEEVKEGYLYNEHFATICDFEAQFGKAKYENFGYYGLRHRPRKLDLHTLNLKRGEIGILGFTEIDKLNRVRNLTKFWNRLY